MVAVCRDELVFDVESGVTDRWGPAFDLGSLAGMLFLGRTGVQAALHHAPSSDGRHRYVVIALPHIAIDADGSVGVVRRPGQHAPSSACGALLAFQQELAAGQVKADIDPSDLEQTLLRHRLFRLIEFTEIPDLVTVTALARQAITEDLRAAAAVLAEQPHSDVAVFVGTLVHGPDGAELIAPGDAFVTVDGGRTEQLP